MVQDQALTSEPRVESMNSSGTQLAHNFDVYGFKFALRTAADDVLQGLEQDFEFFRTDAAADVTIQLLYEEPPVDDVPLNDAIVYTPRNLVYVGGGKRYIDYHGRALGVQDTETGNFVLYSRDLSLLYEGAYLYLLSQIGKHLDSCGLHRIHALGVAVDRRAVLVLLPMGGGKSSLGLQLLNFPEVRLLSDDSPFLDRNGQVLAYPLRIGLLPGSEQCIPADQRRTIQRMEFGPKHLVNYAYFKDRVESVAPPGFVFVGARSMASRCRIEEIGPLAGLRACFSNCVVGLGLFQGMEFILQTGLWELCKKVTLGLSRLWNCWQLIRRSRVCRIHLGRDQELNARTLLQYVQRQLAGQPALSSFDESTPGAA